MRTYRNRARRERERGLLTTELAILMPVMLLIALVAVFAVHVQRHESRAQQAADAAARAASLTNDESAARLAAEQAAARVCQGPVMLSTLDYKAAEADQYLPGRVFVDLQCTERFSGFDPLIDDYDRTTRGTAVSVIEYWRPSP